MRCLQVQWFYKNFWLLHRRNKCHWAVCHSEGKFYSALTLGNTRYFWDKTAQRTTGGLISYGSSCVAAVTQQLFFLFLSCFFISRAERKYQFLLHEKYEKSFFCNTLWFLSWQKRKHVFFENPENVLNN